MVKKKNRPAKKNKKVKKNKSKKRSVKVVKKTRVSKKHQPKKSAKLNRKKIKKIVKLKTKKAKAAPKIKGEKLLGKIDHFFDKISVAAISVKAPFKVGDILHIKGHTTDFTQLIESIQIDHQSVLNVKKGDDVGIKVKEYVRPHDKVYLATEEKKSVSLSTKPEVNIEARPEPKPEVKTVAPISFHKPDPPPFPPLQTSKKFYQTTIFEPGKELSPAPPKPTLSKPASQASPEPKPEVKKPETRKPDPYSNMKFFNF